MIRVVPDTNIMLSGLFGAPSPSRQLLNLALAKKVVLYGSEETFKEFCEKINMPRVQKFWKRQIYTPEKLKLDYRALVKMVEPFELLEGVDIVTRDPDDNIYFRVAKASKSKIVVSGDKDVLSVKKYDGIVAVTVRNFIDSFSKQASSKIY